MDTLEIVKVLELLRKERTIHATITKSEYEAECLDVVISMLMDEMEERI